MAKSTKISSPPDSPTVARLPEESDSLTRSIHLGVLALMVPVSLVFIGFIFAFGKYGDRLMAGVELAIGEAQYSSGLKFQQLGNTERAITYYQEALRGRFRDEESRYLCARALGELLHQEGRFEEAVAVYQLLPPKAFSFAGAYSSYAASLLQMGLIEDGIRVAKKWLKLAESTSDFQQVAFACTLLGNEAYKAQRLDEALSYYRRAGEADPSSQSKVFIGQVIRDQGDRARAVAYLETLLQDSAMKQWQEDIRALVRSIDPNK